MFDAVLETKKIITFIRDYFNKNNLSMVRAALKKLNQ